MTIGKRKIQLRIDAQPDNPFGSAGADSDAASGFNQAAPPILPTIPAPTLLSLTPSLLQSAVTPSAQIAVVWSNLETYATETYRVQVATDSGFTALVGTWATGQNQSNAVIAPLKTSTTYYVRVQTIVTNSNSGWSNVLSTTTGADTTTPAQPSGAAATFAGIGDLVVTWTNPTSSNFEHVEISIWDSASKTTLLGTFYDASQRFVWSAAQNLVATSNVGDPVVYVELKSQSYAAVFSAAVVVGTITKAVPATPTVTLVKSATHQLVATISSTRGVDVARYEFVFKRDGTTVATKLATDNFALYELSAAADAGYHSWTVVARAQDGLNQFSASSAASSAVVVDLLTLDLLRSGLLYSDSDSNTSTTLASLKDGVTASGGVSYAA